MSNKNKLFLYRLLVAFIIWICFTSIAFISIFTYTFLFVQPFGVCDAGVIAYVWLDANGNGVEDYSERPFGGACLWVNSQYPKLDVDIHNSPVCDDKWDYSDDNGDWVSPLFSCSEDIVFVSTRPPAGYKSSTIPVILSSGQDIKFGIAPGSVQTSSEIKELKSYVDTIRSERSAQNKGSRFFTFGLLILVFSMIISVLIAKKLVKPRS